MKNIKKSFPQFWLNYFIFLLLLIGLFSSCKPDKAIIINKVKDVAQLATVEIKIKKMAYYASRKYFFYIIGSGTNTLLSQYNVTIKAGIDLKKISLSCIKDIAPNKIEIKLPSVEIFVNSFDDEHIYPRFTKNGFLNRLTLKQIEDFKMRADLELRECYDYIGIKEEAEKRTKTFLENLLSKFGYDEVNVVFPKSSKLSISQ